MRDYDCDDDEYEMVSSGWSVVRIWKYRSLYRILTFKKDFILRKAIFVNAGRLKWDLESRNRLSLLCRRFIVGVQLSRAHSYT